MLGDTLKRFSVSSYSNRQSNVNMFVMKQWGVLIIENAQVAQQRC